MTGKYVFCGVIVKYIQNKQTEFHVVLHSDILKIISIYAQDKIKHQRANNTINHEPLCLSPSQIFCLQLHTAMSILEWQHLVDQ